jgi:hypothetical protein
MPLPRLRNEKWKQWCKLWMKRKKRLQFYQALSSFQERNNFKILLKASKRKEKLYKKRMNYMYNTKLNRLIKKFKIFKKQIIKFQLKYGIYHE